MKHPTFRFTPIFLPCCLASLALLRLTHAADWPQWQGAERDGISREAGLIQQWPAGGLRMLWSNAEAGEGFSTPIVSAGRIYVTGIADQDEFVTAFDLEGTRLWRRSYGKPWTKSFPPARCAPTVLGDRLYVISGQGEISCLQTGDGTPVWKVAAKEKFQGVTGKWGTSESPLIFDDLLIYTPCGPQTTLVALNTRDGSTRWKSKSLNDLSGYASPILVNYRGQKQIVQVTGHHILGVNPEDGSFLWKVKYSEIKPQKRGTEINTNSPIYHDGRIFVTSGYNHVGVMIALPEKAGEEARVLWTSDTLDTHHGGGVKVGDQIYGANWLNNAKGNWVCLDWADGRVRYETPWYSKGNVTATSDGILFLYEEKGHLGMLRATPEKFDLLGEMEITLGEKQHWCHPAISNGRLYLRHGSALMAFDISAP